MVSATRHFLIPTAKSAQLLSPNSQDKLTAKFLWLAAWGVLLWGNLAGCNEPTGDLRGSVQILCTERGEVAERAFHTIAPYGRKALPMLEAALHRGTGPGRHNVVMALQRLQLAESAALLGHVAAFDTEAAVRVAAYHTLETWAASPNPKLSTLARSSLEKADAARSTP